MFGSANVVFSNVAFANVAFSKVVDRGADRVVDSIVDSVVDSVVDRLDDNVSFVLVVIKSSKGINSSSFDNWFKVVVSSDEISESVALIVINIVGFTSEIITGVGNVVDKLVFKSSV